MLSRVAERIYWLARYLERIENTARLVSVYDNLLYDLPRGNSISWYNLIVINSGTEQFHERYKVKSERNVVKFLLADDDNYASLMSSIRMLRENVRTSRDVIPSETWELTNELYIYVRENISQGVNRSKRHEFLTHVIESCQMITGLLVGAMARDAGWNFMILGCNIERADMTTRMLDAGTFLAMEPFEESNVNLTQVIWSKVLRSQSAYLTYRRTVRRAIRASNVVNYLLNDEQFPRTFYYCVEQMDRAAKYLPRSASVRTVLKDIKSLKYVIESSQDLTDDFRSYLNELQIDLIKLNEVIVENWFAFKEEDAA
ncbi:alpha-E domain-containing protein [Reinekea marinisedimentorum]|uniref:Putative alpha-E superfamily protein n=1 Tax=Reinekea marinisedimentorum TaxID=230495 RepID=A0A4R3ICB4_9GAMM|nr:alpha-E domain-containing protein [Reinekea marinisedimentorum]TCS43265.1 putative alpha-E superfamily protein [Reinekea marinisedimentorum]